MKKLLILMALLVSCKTTKHKCDAYSLSTEDPDIHKISFESQKKYSSVVTIKK